MFSTNDEFHWSELVQVKHMAYSVIAVVAISGFAATNASAVVISFDQDNGTIPGGNVSYDGEGGALTGSGIQFVSLAQTTSNGNGGPNGSATQADLVNGSDIGGGTTPPPINEVPEPAEFGMFGLGVALLLVGVYLRRRDRGARLG